ncbi:hypothetical protein Ga0074812_12947 [Parafrankia irregularis]|uniref:Uncharacterized protein n=1 Tax=Parafrankia irregularis TaxID=795642 RepID=A0A0S4QWH9_9ACTN|nr:MULTISPECIES: hypothetical protein [Parafrankia]MBE3202499.1 hypothetical protein [Parafrankia sp. CH37]CUU59577.1 hypothetical protein Ga0074812_12947 [Parafrankia irregularis]
MSREPESAAGASLPPADAPSTLVTRFSASAPSVARVTADEQQAAPEPAGAGAGAGVGAAGATAGTGAGTGTASGDGGRIPDAEIAGLAERIYEYLARRLRAELLADRERRGLLADPL